MTLTLQTHTITVPKDLPADKRLRLVVALFDARLLSHGQAAETAVLSRATFLDSLGQFGVTPFQYDTASEILRDAKDAAL